MPILQLQNPAFISIDGAGRPNAGGTIEVYEADGTFTTLATTYSDQVKTSELTNPVIVDSAGVKEIWFDVKVDIREKTPAGVVIRDTLNIDPNASQASVQGFNLAQNGSFEIDATSDGQPDNWTITPYSGSAIAITESVVRHGTKALEFNTAGAASGGGTATSAKFPVSEGGDLSVSWSFYATHATTTSTFSIKWYDESDVLKSTTTLTMPTAGSVPTSWTDYAQSVTADAAATQGEIVLTGISSGGSNLTSKAYFDGIEIVSLSNLVSLDETQTLTNKTHTSPTIATPLIDGDVTEKTTNADLNLVRNGTGDITVDGVPIYGLVILDQPVNVLQTNSATGDWTQVDMSSAYAIGATAGATKAILNVFINAFHAGTTSAISSTLYLQKRGAGLAKDFTTRKANCADAATSGSQAKSGIDMTEVVVNLDSNSDFDYHFITSGASSIVCSIHIVGYYV